MTLRKIIKILKFRNNQTNQSFYKLDTFIRNTAPSHIPITEVLKKAGGLLTVGLNFKAYIIYLINRQAYPSLENL